MKHPFFGESTKISMVNTLSAIGIFVLLCLPFYFFNRWSYGSGPGLLPVRTALKSYSFPELLDPAKSLWNTVGYQTDLRQSLLGLTAEDTVVEYLIPEEFLLRRLRLIRETKFGDKINIGYYIIQPDQTGLAIASELVLAADRGVKIRILVDGMGAGPGFPDPYFLFTSLSKAGIEAKIYNHSLGETKMVGKAISGKIYKRVHTKIFQVNHRAILGSGNIWNYTLKGGGIETEVTVEGSMLKDVEADFERIWASPKSEFVSTISPPQQKNLRLNVPTDPKDLVARYQWYKPSGKEIPSEQTGFKVILKNAKYVYDEPNRPDFSGHIETHTTEKQPFETFDSKRNTFSRTMDDAVKEILEYRGVVGEIYRAIVGARYSVEIVSPYFGLPDQIKEIYRTVRLSNPNLKIKLVTSNYEVMGAERPLIKRCYWRDADFYAEVGIDIFELNLAEQLHAKFVLVDSETPTPLFYFGSFNFNMMSALMEVEHGFMLRETVPNPPSGALTFSKILKGHFDYLQTHSTAAVLNGKILADKKKCRGGDCGSFVIDGLGPCLAN